MGKCYVKPLVHTELNNPPKLKWFKIFNGKDQAGDILASFELIMIKDRSLMTPTSDVIRKIPPELSPKLSQYTLEVIFMFIINIF